MKAIGEGVTSSYGIPNLYCRIPRTRGNTLAIGRPGHFHHPIGMTIIGEVVMACSRIPDLNCLIQTSRSDKPTIGGPCYGLCITTITRMIGVGQNLVPRSCKSQH